MERSKKSGIPLVSSEFARQLVLQTQALGNPWFRSDKSGVLSCIQQLSYVQIDTLAVVARAHHHTLWTRLPHYQESQLAQLLEKDRSVFEYWSHAASYLPMSNYRFSLPRKREYASGRSHWFGQDKKVKAFVLDRIKREGPLQSKDFEHKRQGPGNWYDWKPAKQALEQLFMEGNLMVAKRLGFQKVYDLTERVLPSDTDTRMPSSREYAEFLIRSSLKSHGIMLPKEMSYLRRNIHPDLEKSMKRMLSEGELIELRIEQDPDRTYLAFPEVLKTTFSESERIQLLSPFDNLIIQRQRVKQLFGFDYMIECYLPESKRKYGYFSLPVLYGNKFVARFDPKADRAQKVFYLKNFHFEKGFKPSDDFNHLFVERVREFAHFNQCDRIQLLDVEAKWKKKIQSLF